MSDYYSFYDIPIEFIIYDIDGTLSNSFYLGYICILEYIYNNNNILNRFNVKKEMEFIYNNSINASNASNASDTSDLNTNSNINSSTTANNNDKTLNDCNINDAKYN